MRPLHTPTLESIVRDFGTRRGLYILGAGASAGLVPFGSDFIRGPAVGYVHGGSFPADLPQQSELTRLSAEALVGMNVHDRLSLVYPGRVLRPGTLDFAYKEALSRQPDLYTRLFLKDALGQSRFKQKRSDSYQAFQIFYPSTILNYNLDGLASDLNDSFHKVIAAHGTVEDGYGSPQMADLLAYARESDSPVPPDDILLCAPESFVDRPLRRRLSAAMESRPEFIAVIGYSFGRVGDAYDDRVSWRYFCHAFRAFTGNVYVIEPKPEELRGAIADAIESDNVFGICTYWNVLAHAFIQASGSLSDRRSLNYVSQQILDTSSHRVLFRSAMPMLSPLVRV